MYVKDEKLLEALKLISKQPTSTNLQFLMKKIYTNLSNLNNKHKEYHRAYMRLYRFFKKLKEKGLIQMFRRDGLIWIYPHNPKIFDLIKASEKLKQREKYIDSIFKFPKRARPERIEALKVVISKNMLTFIDKQEIKKYYELYLEDVRNRVIILKRAPDAPTFYPLFIKLYYKTRFTSKAYRDEALEKYNLIWHKAGKKFKTAVFITLTTDPKRFKSLWHGWKHFQIAWNRFMSFIQRRLGYRPPYIIVNEFTKTGLLHAHVIIFGVSYLIGKYHLSEIWERHGQGSITWIYKIKKTRKGWVWARRRPPNASRKTTVEAYLMKYLKKAFYESHQLMLYWCSGKRFFSYSRSLKPDSLMPEPSLGIFYFLLSCYEYEIPDMIYNYLEYGIEPYPAKPPPSNYLYSYPLFHKFV